MLPERFFYRKRRPRRASATGLIDSVRCSVANVTAFCAMLFGGPLQLLPTAQPAVRSATGLLKSISHNLASVAVYFTTFLGVSPPLAHFACFYITNVGVLLIGATGAGKSTLVNSLATFSQFKTLKQATDEEPVFLIPSNYLISSRTYGENKRIIVRYPNGDPRSQRHQTENLRDGEACTKGCTLYHIPFEFGSDNYMLHVFDTPGKNDTEGPEQDRKNATTIAVGLKKAGVPLNGICIVIQDGLNRIEPSVQHYFLAIFEELHAAAKGNVAFCVTNCEDGYATKTSLALNKFLERLEADHKIVIKRNKENTFCFENKFYNFIQAQHAGMQFTKREVEGFQESWDKSFGEMQRLLQNVSKFKAHDPLMEKLRNVKTVTSDLMRDMYRLVKRYPTTESYSPTTVCSQCKVHVDEENFSGDEYTRNCHYQCSCPNIVSGIQGHAGLKSCTAFDGGCRDTCTECGHHWTKHVHFKYFYIYRYENVTNEGIKKQYDAKRGEASEKEKWIDLLEGRKRELEQEDGVIRNKILALVCAILQTACVGFNDPREEYLEQTKEIAQTKGDKVTVKSCEDALARHREMRDMFSKNPGKAEAKLGTSDPASVLSKLFRLKKMGSYIRSSYELYEKEAKEAEKLFAEVWFVPKEVEGGMLQLIDEARQLLRDATLSDRQPKPVPGTHTMGSE